jgi:intracellular sulfur oxidation DsrE/DsrF family protein
VNLFKLTRYSAILTAMVCGCFSQVGLADAAPAMKQAAQDTQKVVFQVSDNDPQKWGLTLNNVRNVQQVLGADRADIEVVVYGPGISMLKLDSPDADRIDQARKAGIRIVACENTMKAQKLTKEDMLPSIGYVPGGVVELMKKEQEGYAYIRP